MDRSTRINIGQRAHGFVLHALAYWPTFRGYEPVSEETAAAELGVLLDVLQQLKEGNLEAIPDLNQRVRRKIGRLSVGGAADVVDYYLPTKLSPNTTEPSDSEPSS